MRHVYSQLFQIIVFSLKKATEHRVIANRVENIKVLHLDLILGSVFFLQTTLIVAEPLPQMILMKR